MTVTVLDLTKDCYQQGKKELNSQSVSVGFSKRQLQHVPSLAGFWLTPLLRRKAFYLKAHSM